MAEKLGSAIPIPVSQAARDGYFDRIELIATDIDGTLTQHGKFSAALWVALEELAQFGVRVLFVTGRSAGWVSALRNYFPITGAIAENGGLYYFSEVEAPDLLTPIGDLALHRQHLATTFQFLQTKFPQICESTDNRFRLTDWTFDVEGLSDTELKTLDDLCGDRGWSFTYSTVQCHIKPAQQDKAKGLQQVLQKYFPQLTPAQILTVGDSPNDEAMFDPNKFPVSAGVANILDYADRMVYRPTFVTTLPEVEGFCELVRRILARRE